jgi:hypothetical protein
MRDTRGSASRRNPGLNDEIPLGFPKRRPPDYSGDFGMACPNHPVGIFGGDGSIIPLGFWEGMPQSFRWDFGRACPPIIPDVSDGNAPIISLKYPVRITPKITLGTVRLSTQCLRSGARRRRANHLAQRLPRQRLPWVCHYQNRNAAPLSWRGSRLTPYDFRSCGSGEWICRGEPIQESAPSR